MKLINEVLKNQEQLKMLNKLTEEKPLSFQENQRYQRKILRFLISKLHQIAAMQEQVDQTARGFFINENEASCIDIEHNLEDIIKFSSK